jgi:hypothetical protein
LPSAGATTGSIAAPSDTAQLKKAPKPLALFAANDQLALEVLAF